MALQENCLVNILYIYLICGLTILILYRLCSRLFWSWFDSASNVVSLVISESWFEPLSLDKLGHIIQISSNRYYEWKCNGNKWLNRGHTGCLFFSRERNTYMQNLCCLIQLHVIKSFLNILPKYSEIFLCKFSVLYKSISLYKSITHIFSFLCISIILGNVFELVFLMKVNLAFL